ncbi:E3 ubiquitin-protein ligase highwire [Papilio machaon]|uniref:E3 ubiquitin-protein ligase highwire n=1 Tax=Papilio machaon TaxID=76193 RepID=A0A194QXP2_PAPMA|nr:E3 ubiquitin-protein ligase highwire [Papilio machaon]
MPGRYSRSICANSCDFRVGARTTKRLYAANCARALLTFVTRTYRPPIRCRLHTPYEVRFSIGVVNSRSEKRPQKEYADDTSALTYATPNKNKHTDKPTEANWVSTLVATIPRQDARCGGMGESEVEACRDPTIAALGSPVAFILILDSHSRNAPVLVVQREWASRLITFEKFKQLNTWVGGTVQLTDVHDGCSDWEQAQYFESHMEPCSTLASVSTESKRNTSNAAMSDMLPRAREPPRSPAVMHRLAVRQPPACRFLSKSAENQFLVDFVAGAENTAGGRLARWLAPMPHVDPSKCELKLLSSNSKPALPITVCVVIRDQYGEPVISPSLRVEILVLRLRNNVGGKRRYNVDDENVSVPDVPYQITVRENVSYHAITMMQPYQNYSFEEIRLANGMWWDEDMTADGNDEETMMNESMMINAQADGTYLATWVPHEPGDYVGTCLLDHVPTNLEVVFEVSLSHKPKDDKAVQSGNFCLDVDVEALQSRQRRFEISNSAGLRVRSSPSLQAEEIGRIPRNANVGFVEEVENKDGVWVRLSEEAMKSYTTFPVAIAWCLQYHRQLDLVLLVSNQTSEADEEEITEGWIDDQQAEPGVWKPDEKDSTNDASDDEDRRFPFSIDLGNDSDEGSTLFVFGAEPSKRCRLARKGAAAAGAVAAGSPRRFQRKSNGNREEMIARRHDDNVQDANVQETDIEPEPRSHSRLAQAGTQTSPDTYAEGALAQMFLGSYNADGDVEDLNEERQRSRSGSRDRSKARALRNSPPPLPARASSSAASPPPPLPPRKHAICPTQAKCMRSIFAALLWHEGAVHDAIACATFLKFHPCLPRAGASVVTRGAAHVPPAPRPQRHSVEVASSGQYLNLNPSTLESLTRSGNEACASRERRIEMDEAIREEEAGTSEAGGSSPAVVNVLPPALRALVSLWDALYDSDQLAVVTDKFKKGVAEKQESDDTTRYSGIRKKKDRKTSPMAKAPYSVHCELCGGAKVPPPLGAHMRHSHPGCRAPSATGYDRAGVFRHADAPPHLAVQPLCGQVAQGKTLI